MKRILGFRAFAVRAIVGRILGFRAEDLGFCGDLILAFVGFRVFVGRRLSFGLWLGGF